MSTLNRITVDIELGQTILVGPNNQPAQITKIEFHPKSGEISLNTTRGPRNALTFKLMNGGDQEFSKPADRYR
jgi:hypothetical protein